MNKVYSLTVLLAMLLAVSIVGQETTKVTYVANEGFLIENSDKKILIDGLFGNFQGDWCDIPSKTITDEIENGISPFNDIDIIAVTHKHRDHFTEGMVVNFLLNNNTTILLCPKQVDSVLALNSNYDKFKDRVISITPDEYKDSNLVVKGIPITVMRLEHSHYMEEGKVEGVKINRHRNIENIGYIFNVNGNSFFHCGDTNPLNEKEYSTFFKDREAIDVAFLDRTFYSRGETTVKIINEYVSPKNVVLMHISPANKNMFADHLKGQKNHKVFKNKMEMIELIN